jgi:16S rRNA (adenine1518-N6/adenine1519-N6)-dimethyltransferase
LARFNLHPRKRFGQNFLVDEHVLAKIVSAAELTPADTVLEVGPGLGTLTTALAEQAGQVVAVELDRDLVRVLETTVGHLPNVRVVQGDILDLSLDELLPAANGPLKVVANLPYYVTSPVLLKFLLSERPWARLVFMVQREVAERLAAAPGSKTYGSLSVVLRFSADPVVVARVPRTAFFPSPDVDSAILALSPRPAPLPPGPERDTFYRTVRAAFGQRRKKLSNALTGAGFPAAAVAAALGESGVDGGRRGETLDLSEFVALAVSLSAQMLASTGI